MFLGGMEESEKLEFLDHMNHRLTARISTENTI
jgi:hypothetical protein